MPGLAGAYSSRDGGLYVNTVFPIKDAKKLNEIIKGLADYETERERRIYLLFMVGICTGLRIGDMIGLTVGQVNRGDKLRLIEEKTGKEQSIKINKQLRAVLDAELEGLNDDAYLFPSRQKDRRGRVKHISVSTAEKDLQDVKYWFNLRYPFSCHSLRKTYGYWHYQMNHNLPLLAKQFNHSDTRVTLAYIGLDEDEAAKATENMYDGVFVIERKTKAKKRSNQTNDKVITKHHDRAAQKKAFAERMNRGKQEAQQKRKRGQQAKGASLLAQMKEVYKG